MANKKGKKWIAAFLAAALALTGVSVPAVPAEAADNTPSLTIDMGETGKRGLYHGATGWLYGQGDDQVPTANTITALKPNTAVQKAPNGMQHPNGDVLDIADTFLDAGGKHIQIYVPDYYALWFYEFTGTDYYLDILEMQAKACIEKGIAEDVVYVLYNEPTANWIGGSYKYVDDDGTTGTATGWDSMNWFWKDMVEKLREVYRNAGIQSQPKTAGLNLAVYDKSVMDNYIKFCAEHGCMPDIVSWHDLATWQYDIFDDEYSHYRSLEKKYNVEPREIVINEYAAQAECASPGDLVRWIGLWEDYEVAGCLPFWHFSNNLNGLAANNNAGNGAWWLYKWYGDMSGSYLPVSVANASQNDFYGAASMDENKKNAEVIFGGRDGSANIILEDLLSTQTFRGADKVHIKVESTDYTGFHGAAEEPRVLKEGTVAVTDGKAIVPMSDMNAMSGYHITVTQASADEALGLLTDTWKAKYEAEDGILTGNARVAEADGSYACSNRKKVHYVDNPGDSVALQVNVPKDGYYKYDLVYCAATGVNTNDPANNTPYTAIQNLVIDGSQTVQMTLPSTLHWSMGGMYSTYIYLTAGAHTLKIEATSSQGKAVPDCVYLTYQGTEQSDTMFDQVYEAELGEFNEIKGAATTLTTTKEGNVGYITGLEGRKVTEGGGVRFNAVVPENGMYRISLRYQAQADAAANLYLDNDMVNLDRLRASVELKATGDAWKTVYQEAFLQEGINVLDIDATGAVKLDSVRVKAMESSQPVAAVEAESAALTGSAAVGSNRAVQSFSSGNGYVSAIKAANGVELIPEGDPGFTILGLGRTVDKGEPVDKNSMSIKVNAPQAGNYKLVVYQSNGELFGKHSYNAQMTERYASFAVNGQAPQKVVFRNTYSDEAFMPQAVDVALHAGENTIKIYNDNSKVVTNGVLKNGQTAHRPENIDYAVLTNYTPNFDKFELYALVGAQGQEEASQTYKVSTRATKGGRVDAGKKQVEAGESLELFFEPESGYVLKDALVNGRSIMDALSTAGGYYTLSQISQDVEVAAYFEAAEGKAEIVRQADFEYAVNAGDIDPATLSEGDSFGLRNSVTEQFYGEDSVTGKYWGVVDTFRADASHSGWLTGEKTWPCENDGATDASPKEKSFRYLRNQPTSDPGIIYQFELEPGESYDAELGFYVPSSWTSNSNPRTMKLVINGQAVEGYESFTASNDSSSPFKIQTRVTAGQDGMVKIQIGHADNAVWGPVISYLQIFRQADTALLAEELAKCSGYQEQDYGAAQWKAFADAREEAQRIMDNSSALTNISSINEALYHLQAAAANLNALADTSELEALYRQYEGYPEKTGQGLTEIQDWQAFQDALKNAKLLLDRQSTDKNAVESVTGRLKATAGKLLLLKRIAVTKLPTKVSYQVGEGLVTDGLEVTAYDQNGKAYVLEPSRYTISGLDSSAAGQKTITVTFQDQTATFTVEVKKAEDKPKPPKPEVKAPAAPKAQKGTCTYNSIQIKWKKVKNASGYQIYRATSKKGSYKKIKTITKQSTISFKDTKLGFNKAYYYKVKAYVKDGKTVKASKYSNTISAKTALGKPALTAKKKSKTAVRMSWKKVSGATGYQVQYSLKKKSGYKTVYVKNKNAKSYIQKKLKAGKTYYVRMRAYRTVKSKKVPGAWSSVKQVKLR